MKVAVPHNTTRAKARRILEERLADAQKQFGHHIEKASYEWTGDVLYVELKGRGLSGKGTVEVTDTEVIIDGKLPLLALPFEGRIRQMVRSEAESMFRTA